VQGAFLLDIVISQSSAIFQLLPGKDQALLIRGDPLLVLDLLFHILNGIRGIGIQCDCLTGQGLDEDLH